MDSIENKKLLSYYSSLIEQKQFLDTLKGGPNVRVLSIRPIIKLFDLIEKDFPHIFPYNANYSRLGNDAYVDYIAFRSFLAIVISNLKLEVDQPSEISVIEKRQFTFISDFNLRTVIERDYEEIQRAFVSRCWKSVVILSGGTIEAILTDLLLSNKSVAVASQLAPKKHDITRWQFSELIDVSVDVGLVSAGIQKLSHPIREYRNLVHPSNEIRNGLHIDAEEARIAIELIHMLHRDLS